MNTPVPAPPSPHPARPVFAIAALTCPSLLFAGYLFLASSVGGRWFDRHSLGSYSSGIVAFGALVLTVAALVLIGFSAGVISVRKREQPRWLSMVALTVNAALLGIAFMML